MSNTDTIVLTEIENKVLRKLHERVKMITGGKTPNRKHITAIINSCSSWSFPVIFENENPDEVANACKSLLEKKMVEQFDNKGFPAFVPVSETTIVEYSYRKFTQSDV